MKQLMSVAAYQQTPIDGSGVRLNALPNRESSDSPDEHLKLSWVTPIRNGVHIDYIKQQ